MSIARIKQDLRQLRIYYVFNAKRIYWGEKDLGKVWFRRVSQLLVLLLVFTYAFILLPIGIEQADAETVIAHLGAGETPSAASVNPATNKIYVTNRTSNNVTVIDGATNTITSAVYAGNSPGAVAVNPATNMIYVTNFISTT